MDFKQAVKIIRERSSWKIIDIDWEKKIIKFEGLLVNLKFLMLPKLLVMPAIILQKKEENIKIMSNILGPKRIVAKPVTF